MNAETMPSSALALAFTLVPNTRILASEEPLGALDALKWIHMQKDIEAVWLKEGITAIFATHDVVEALRLEVCIILIEDDEIAGVFFCRCAASG